MWMKGEMATVERPSVYSWLHEREDTSTGETGFTNSIFIAISLSSQKRLRSVQLQVYWLQQVSVEEKQKDFTHETEEG